ncbi:hypothetical protein RND81_04G198800 [Saponaria officinalis]|uniref:non-specific serine/threonine protein kinase n=1 Tax=Saponaria officinalis TaxID=3572 RepID=A0AAW1LNW5_SAPOF
MICSAYYLIICTIVAFCCLKLCTAGNNETDRIALLEIKARIVDPFGVLSSWNDTQQFCDWYGITCGVRHQRVTSLDLQSSKLSGFVSPYIGNLSFLKDLQLQNNSFGGTLPPEIGRLRRLQHLLIFNNSIAGEIPRNISGCYGLIRLSAANNKLVGSIPDEMGTLPNLQHLSLPNNKLTGNLPSSLGNVSSLSVLSLANIDVVGNVPSSFGRLKNLTYLSLSENKLSGLVPSSIFNLSRLTFLDLGENRLEGSLPSDIGVTLPLLEDFLISQNWFSGVIPTSVSNLSHLRILQLTSNNLRGEVPPLKTLVNLTNFDVRNNSLGYGQTDDLNFVTSLGNATLLSIFSINDNNFGGNFPRIVCNFSALTFLVMGENKITGQVPDCIDNLQKLELFSIMMNHISGVIPQSVGKLQNLNTLNFFSNQFSGYIPFSVGNLTKLNFLNLDSNGFVGQIPVSIGNCTQLLGLDLSQNNLKGSIPSEILSLSSLSIVLYLFENHLTGPLGSEVGQLKTLTTLDISSNMLSGKIPTSLSACVELEVLSMEDNFFEGVIPDALKTLMSLQELNLSRNNLTGKIPTFLVSFPLIILDLSYNNFKGEVPIGEVFGNATGVSTVGNDMLCGGIPVLKLPKCPSEKTQMNRSNHRKSLILAMVFGFLGIIMLVTSASLGIFWYRKRSRKTATSDTVTRNSLSNLSYQNLLKATNGFSSENMLGSGTFGDVYKGILDPDETVVAIKVFKLEHHGSSKSFMAECGVLRNTRHRNLVKVITACSTIDYQAKDFKALVYEYMVNGSLEDWLHPEARRIDGINSARQTLNFRQRLDIVVDVAFAVEYLHHRSGASIVHCDLKPSNVLLDEEMVAHVGDFGLAKFLAAQAFRSSSLAVRGTVGYAPPGTQLTV